MFVIYLILRKFLIILFSVNSAEELEERIDNRRIRQTNKKMLISEVKQVFESKHIQLQNDFLEQVFQWIQETYPHASDEEVIINIYKEWLHLDWRDEPMSILPPNINRTTNTTINNIFYLQLLNVVDISITTYVKKLKSIRSRFDDHTEEMEYVLLKLQLTDGIQQIAAVECNKVPCLNLNLPPGMKVKFVPPIYIRSGRIMLKPGMIELIGGGVPKIEVANCVANRPVMTIEKLNKIKDKDTNGIFKIKMEILEVKRKFQVQNMEYSMKVLVTDDTAEIEVMLGHKVMLGIVKVTPDVLLDLQNSGEWSDHVKLESIKDNLTEAINDFYAHVTLVIEANSVPVVTEVLETFQLPGN